MKESKIAHDELKQTVKFLKDYNFIVVDEKKERMKLQEMAQKLLAENANP
jgi:hypothetical protein